MEWYKNEKVLSFIGGAAAVIVGSKILKMPKTRELCVKGLAGGITAKNNVSAAIQNIKMPRTSVQTQGNRQQRRKTKALRKLMHNEIQNRL